MSGFLSGVSIPLWFDWKGAPPEKAAPICGFNSTLVRLEAVEIVWKINRVVVSIPLWFDWKCLVPASLGRFYPVSIPLWFDWKYAYQNIANPSVLFQFHFGSIGSQLKIVKGLNYAVSIPLWFDWKFSATPRPFEFGLFQFHFGSIGR